MASAGTEPVPGRAEPLAASKLPEGSCRKKDCGCCRFMLNTALANSVDDTNAGAVKQSSPADKHVEKGHSNMHPDKCYCFCEHHAVFHQSQPSGSFSSDSTTPRPSTVTTAVPSFAEAANIAPKSFMPLMTSGSVLLPSVESSFDYPSASAAASPAPTERSIHTQSGRLVGGVRRQGHPGGPRDVGENVASARGLGLSIRTTQLKAAEKGESVVDEDAATVRLSEPGSNLPSATEIATERDTPQVPLMTLAEYHSGAAGLVRLRRENAAITQPSPLLFNPSPHQQQMIQHMKFKWAEFQREIEMTLLQPGHAPTPTSMPSQLAGSVADIDNSAILPPTPNASARAHDPATSFADTVNKLVEEVRSQRQQLRVINEHNERMHRDFDSRLASIESIIEDLKPQSPAASTNTSFANNGSQWVVGDRRRPNDHPASAALSGDNHGEIWGLEIDAKLQDLSDQMEVLKEMLDKQQALGQSAPVVTTTRSFTTTTTSSTTSLSTSFAGSSSAPASQEVNASFGKVHMAKVDLKDVKEASAVLSSSPAPKSSSDGVASKTSDGQSLDSLKDNIEGQLRKEKKRSHKLKKIVETLNQRLEDLEKVAPPTRSRPWEVEVIFLPRGTWPAVTPETALDSQAVLPHGLKNQASRRSSVDRASQSISASQTQGETRPVACVPGSTMYKRLASRGFVKKLLIAGPSYRDFYRPLRNAFKDVVESVIVGEQSPGRSDDDVSENYQGLTPYSLPRTHSGLGSAVVPMRRASSQIGSQLHHPRAHTPSPLGTQSAAAASPTPSSASKKPNNFAWMPLRAVQKQPALRFITEEESRTKALWNIEFLRTCVQRTSQGKNVLYFTTANKQALSAVGKKDSISPSKSVPSGKANLESSSSSSIMAIARRKRKHSTLGENRASADKQPNRPKLSTTWQQIRQMPHDTEYNFSLDDGDVTSRTKEEFWEYDQSLDAPVPKTNTSTSPSTSGFDEGPVLENSERNSHNNASRRRRSAYPSALGPSRHASGVAVNPHSAGEADDEHGAHPKRPRLEQSPTAEDSEEFQRRLKSGASLRRHSLSPNEGFTSGGINEFPGISGFNLPGALSTSFRLPMPPGDVDSDDGDKTSVDLPLDQLDGTDNNPFAVPQQHYFPQHGFVMPPPPPGLVHHGQPPTAAGLPNPSHVPMTATPGVAAPPPQAPAPQPPTPAVDSQPGRSMSTDEGFHE